MKLLKKIAITVPGFYVDPQKGEDGSIDHSLCVEAEAIERNLRSGYFDRVHIRKPEWDETLVRALISRIDPELRSRLSLHSHFHLAAELGVGGLHLNSRSPGLPRYWTGIVSRSAHTVDEALKSGVDYSFLSPIYPSISKPGYKSEENLLIRFGFEDRPWGTPDVIALGGITYSKFSEIKFAGFSGVAMLGAAWPPPVDINKFRLQLITDPSGGSYVEQTQKALEGGCRWIQLRNKHASAETLIRDGKEMARLCRQYDAVLIIDDHVDLVYEIGADGVHLGKNDMDVAEARRILGPSKIIGATANTFEDVMAATEKRADYIGLGPFRFTTTKANLSPTLGVDAYVTITSKARGAHCDLPIVAIGGIRLDDMEQVLSTYVDGVAVSGAILKSDDVTATTREFRKILDKTEIPKRRPWIY